jgi:uncharacterized membrane protein YvbJ
MIHCEGCGAELNDDAKFCNKCGRKVGTAEHMAGETKAVAGRIGHGFTKGVKALGDDVKKVTKKKDNEASEPPPPPPPPPS